MRIYQERLPERPFYIYIENISSYSLRLWYQKVYFISNVHACVMSKQSSIGETRWHHVIALLSEPSWPIMRHVSNFNYFVTV